MARVDTEVPTWSIYPSLLGSLEKKKHREALEQAACAQYCGRFADATTIFDAQLLESYTIPVWILQKADMLTTQGLELERVDLLQRALLNREKASDSDPEVRLFKLMLADAEYWAFGKLNNAFLQAQSIQKWLRTRQLKGLSDIELRCITLYHQILDACKEDSNKVLERHEAIFPGSRKNKFKEFRDLRKTLEGEKRLGWAYTMMRLELNSVSSANRQESVDDCMKLCEDMEATGFPQYQFRSASLKMKLFGIFFETEPQKSTQFKQEAIYLLQKISPPEFRQWEAYCPALAFELVAKGIKGSEDTKQAKSEQFKLLSKEKVTHHDFTKAHLALISARDYAEQWLAASKNLTVEPVALQNLRQIQASHVELHRTQSHIAYFEGHVLCDYLSTLDIEYHDYKSVLQESESFQQKHQDFEIPRVRERLLNLTVGAAEKLGMDEKRIQYERLYNDTLRQCPFWQKTWGLTDAATLNPDFYFREIQGPTKGQVAWGNNAVKVLLTWAKHEWTLGILSIESWEILFGFAFDEVNEAALESLDPQSRFMDVARIIFGTEKGPSDTDTFLSIVQRLQDWLLLRERPPSRAARLFALKMIMKSRIYRVGEFLAANTEHLNVSNVLRYEEESSVLRDIEALETGNSAEEGTKSDQDKMMAIHMTLTKSFVYGTGGERLVSDDELATRISDAREVIEHFKNNGHRLSEYHAIVQAIRLSWQRHLLFQSVPADYCLGMLEDAERVVNSIRRDISITEAPKSLLAKIKLTDDFNFRDHYNYALVATLKAFQGSQMAAMAAHQRGEPTQSLLDKINESYETFREWTYRSKGRGLTDILGHNSDVVRAFVKQYPELARSDSVLQKESDLVKSVETSPPGSQLQLKADLEHLRETMRTNPDFKELMDFKDGVTISKTQINAMLNEIDGNVVIVDFIHFACQGISGTLKVIMYRKNKLHYPLNIPDVTLKNITSWANENLNNEQMPLADASGENKLQQLSKLIEPLIKTPRPLAIKPGETIIFCPTGDMHRIPLHAIPIDGVPLIERNPVLYCQSLTTLHHCFQLLHNRDQTIEEPQSIVLNPMPDYYEDTGSVKGQVAVTSSKTVADLANNLGGTLHHGFDFKKEDVIRALKRASLIHYHGHAWYGAASPLDSALLLNQAAYYASRQASASTISLTGSNVETLTARDIFGLNLTSPALSVIIGCGSGVTKTSSTDDVLGLPTAFIYAGSSAVVSTLWPLEDSDGAGFSNYFYEELWRQNEALNKENTKLDKDKTSPLKNCVNLARAMQTAVNKLRQDGSGTEKSNPYHWAPFVLSGFWMVPRKLFKQPSVANLDDLYSLPQSIQAKLGI